MRGNNSMNTSSLVCNGRARKASNLRKNGQIFGPKMFGLPLYFRNAAPSTPIKGGSNGPAYEMRKKRQKKREWKRGRKEKQNAGSNRKKKNKKKHLHVHTFSPCPPPPPPPPLPPPPLRHDLSRVQNFGSAWFWRTTYPLSFSNKLFVFDQLLKLDSRPYLHFGWKKPSRKHAYIILTPLNPTFI